jgi:hypothetical protein
MNWKEKYIYHQIHPAKLLTDIAAGIASLYPFWLHQLPLALLIMLVPPLIASLLTIRYANLQRRKESSFGKYVDRNMTPLVEAIRFAGMVLMAAGAWSHSFAMIILGAGAIIGAWGNGRLE